MYNKKTIEDIEVAGKKVLVRCDFNVPMKDETITDDKRIVEALPTIQYLIAHNAKLILCSHMGRPKGEFNMKYSLRPVAVRLSELLVRFHDLRHTFATMALENGIDIKTLAEILGHNTVSTALNTYTHSTAKMQEFAARRIDRVIGRVDDDAEQNINTTTEVSGATEPVFAPYKRKKRKSGTGYVKQLSANCWQGRYTPRVDGKRVSYNVYGKTEEECETKLAEVIREKRNR